MFTEFQNIMTIYFDPFPGYSFRSRSVAFRADGIFYDSTSISSRPFRHRLDRFRNFDDRGNWERSNQHASVKMDQTRTKHKWEIRLIKRQTRNNRSIAVFFGVQGGTAERRCSGLHAQHGGNAEGPRSGSPLAISIIPNRPLA